jgi:glycosyltransferase involved in cell wall biosynthesis
MKICFIIGYDLDKSPWATRPRAIMEHALQLGHQLSVVDLAEPHKEHAPIHPPLESSPRLTRLRLKQKLLTRFDAPLCYLKARAQLRPLLEKADVVHIQKPKILTWGAARWAGATGTPVVYDWDDLEGTGGVRSGWPGRKVDWMEAGFVKHSRRIVTASRALEEMIKSRYPEHPPLHYIPCGVDVQRFNPQFIAGDRQKQWREKLNMSSGEKIIVYHGQMEMGEQGEALLDAVGRVNETHPARLLLVGGGRLLNTMLESARRKGLKDRVLSTGYVPSGEVPVLLSLADCAVALIPDTPYGLCKSPLKIYEAMAMGVPLIASRVGQAAEVLPGCAKLVTPGGADDLTSVLVDILEHPEQAEAMGRAAREKAIREHTWQKAAGKFMTLYQSLLEIS